MCSMLNHTLKFVLWSLTVCRCFDTIFQVISGIWGAEKGAVLFQEFKGVMEVYYFCGSEKRYCTFNVLLSAGYAVTLQQTRKKNWIQLSASVIFIAPWFQYTLTGLASKGQQLPCAEASKGKEIFLSTEGYCCLL